MNELAKYYETNGERSFTAIPSLFVFVRGCTKGFKESNFNVAKSLLDLFTVVFGVHKTMSVAPDAFLYIPATKLAVEKIADRKLSESAASCLFSICVVKDPQKVISVALKTIEGFKSPSVHEALLVWLKKFFIDFVVFKFI